MQTVPVQPDERRLNRRKEAIRRATSPSNSRLANAEKEAQSLRSAEACPAWRQKTAPRKSIDTRFPCSLIDSGILTRIPPRDLKSALHRARRRAATLSKKLLLTTVLK